MPRIVAFLKGINVGGHVVKMDVLRREFERLGLDAVETFIASGNVVFETRAAAGATLASRIERALRAKLGYGVATFLRTIQDVHALAAARPFADADVAKSSGVFIGFVAEPLTKAQSVAVVKLSSADDVLSAKAGSREIHWCRMRSFKESSLTYTLFEKAIGAQATFRGVSTVQRLAAKYPA
jgi:uncharacterized protein (DUF1697 family)